MSDSSTSTSPCPFASAGLSTRTRLEYAPPRMTREKGGYSASHSFTSEVCRLRQRRTYSPATFLKMLATT